MPHAPITRSRPYTPNGGVVAGKTFTSERQYRNALARAHGFPSWAAQQRAPRRVGGPAALARLRPSEQLARRQAFEALGYMRRDRLSLAAAADRAHTSPNAVLRYAGPAVVRAGARYEATPSDRLYRRMEVLTTEGRMAVDVRTSRTASVVAAHWDAVQRYVDTGDEQELRTFAHVDVGRHRLETDVEVIESLARQGELSFEEIYRS